MGLRIWRGPGVWRKGRACEMGTKYGVSRRAGPWTREFSETFFQDSH